MPGQLYAYYYEPNDEHLVAALFSDGIYRPLSFNGLNIYNSSGATEGYVNFDFSPSPAPELNVASSEIPVEFMDTYAAVSGSVPALIICEWEGSNPPYEWYMQVQVDGVDIFEDYESSPLSNGVQVFELPIVPNI